MSFQNTSEKSAARLERPPPPRTPGIAPVLRPELFGPRRLDKLAPGQCRFCLVDAPKGQMDRALFCAAPAERGPYCADHRARCLAPPPEDIDDIAAEIEAALQPQD